MQNAKQYLEGFIAATMTSNKLLGDGGAESLEFSVSETGLITATYIDDITYTKATWEMPGHAEEHFASETLRVTADTDEETLIGWITDRCLDSKYAYDEINR